MNSKLIEFLLSREEEMFSLLREMILIQSGSYNKKGVDRVVSLIRETFEGTCTVSTTVEQETLGNHLIVRSAPGTGKKGGILLVGHMDTVFPEDTGFNRYREDEENCYGPGIVDMKGGLVCGIFAMKALEHAGLLPAIPVTFLFNSDEEIGSESSRALIREEALKADFAFVLECGGLNGEIVTGRKGNISMTLDIGGEAGHAAFAGEDKGSAILELAHKTIAVEALNQPSRGVSANVGLIRGGIGPNTVAEHAEARLDFRFVDQEDYRRLKESVQTITENQTVPNTTAEIKIVSERPSMPESPGNRALYETIREVASELQIPVKSEFRQGVSDANMIAEVNVPVVDGLGPIGARDHSEDEYMVKESLLSRTTLLACAMAACWKKHGEGALFPAI